MKPSSEQAPRADLSEHESGVPGTLSMAMESAKTVLVATDFDGTLAPIVLDPMCASPLPKSVQAIQELSRIEGFVIAIVSGRDMATLATLCSSLPPCWLIGDHGRSIRRPDGSAPSDWTQACPPQGLEAIQEEAEAISSRHPGSLVERKPFGVCLHSRGVQAGAAGSLRSEAQRWMERGRELGFETMEGREVFEVMTKSEGKLGALEKLVSWLAPDFSIYAGDDTTDLEAVESFSRHPQRMGVWIRSQERPVLSFQPSLEVDGVGGWAEVLEILSRSRRRS